MKKTIYAFIIAFTCTDIFASTTTVNLPVIAPVNSEERLVIVGTEHSSDGTILVGRGDFNEIVVSNNSRAYYTFSYTNGPETGRRMSSYTLNSDKSKQDILIYSKRASESCPFIIWKTINGEISSYEIADCMIQH